MAPAVDPIESILAAAVDIESEADRRQYLERACAGDAGLRQRVDELIANHFRAGSFLESPVPGLAATADQTQGERPGTLIGPYKLLQQIGEGGMGTVFMAEQTAPVKRKVALKVIKAGMDSRQVIARFEAERQALAMMDHVNIARVLDAGTTGTGRPYFVMELVHGVPITRYCDDHHLTPRERLGLFIDVCRAVQHAHQKGVIHRDLKPTNILVTLYDGKPVPKVIDFGVAKATEQKLTERTLFTQYGTMVGTLEYMSPEQAEMSALGADTRSDIYSLGVLLYELLTGTTPLTSGRLKEATYGEIVRLIREEEAPRPSTRLNQSGETLTAISARRRTEPAKLARLVRGELDWIVMKCLEKDRTRRYETASALAKDVEHYLADEPVLACPPSAAYRFRKFARRHTRALVTAAAAVVAMLAAVAGLAVSTFLIAREKGATEQALQELRQDGYFHHITLAHDALSRDDLARAEKYLQTCPDDLRGWEWHYLMRLCRVEPIVFRDNTEVNGLAFTPGGDRLVAACGDGAIKVWDTRARVVVQQINHAHDKFVTCVAAHPDGRHVASVGADKKVRVWDLATGLAVSFEDRCDDVHQYGTAYAVTFSPDGHRLVAGNEGSVKVWDWRAGRLLRSFDARREARLSVAFRQDGGRLASGSWRGSVLLWDPDDESTPPRALTEPGETQHPACALAFSPDGGLLAAASFERRVDVWDTATGGLVHRLLHDSGLVLGVAFSPDGRRLASVGEDKTVHLWDAATGREVLGLRGHTGAVGCVAFSPADPGGDPGRRLASAGKDKTIRVWDATPLQGHERQETQTYTMHTNEIWTMALRPDDGRQMVSGGFGTPPKVWDPETGQAGPEFPSHRDVVFCVAWRPDGQRVASAGGAAGLFTVKVWDPQSGLEDFPLEGVVPGDPEFLAVAFSPPDGRYLVTGRADGRIQVWDGRTGKLVGLVGEHERAVRGVVFSPDGKHLATISVDGMVLLWDATRLTAKPEVRHRLQARVHGPTLNVTFSPDGRRLATSGEENTVKVWDVQTGRELRPPLRGHGGDVYAVAFSPDGRWIASPGEDSTVKVWDSHTGALVRSFRGHTNIVCSVVFSRNGRSLFSGGRDHKVKVWDVSQLEDGPKR